MVYNKKTLKMNKIFSKKTIFFTPIIIGIYFIFPLFTFASETLFVDPSYDLYRRREVVSENIIDVGNLKFNIDRDYYLSLSESGRDKIRAGLYSLGEEFKNVIYPKLTSVFGNEPFSPSGKITIFFHQMQQSYGGYFNSGDQYSRYQYSRSNERNILYLNTYHLGHPLLPAFLAHEFIHIITFNQKDNLNRVTEEVWLNELRAEYAITHLGYDNNYRGSNLESRVNMFLRDTNFSLTEWTGSSGDYGVINLFAQYLVDHYGIEILSESLKSPYSGIESINYALSKRGYRESFEDIFTNWTIALFLNDCSMGQKYCYKNQNLKNLRIMPQITYLPNTDTAQIIISVSTRDWTGNWQRITGGSGKLLISFSGDSSVKFKVPYIICKENNCSIDFLNLNNSQEGAINIEEFNGHSITILPSIQNKTKGFNGLEKNYHFSLNISIEKKENLTEENRERKEMLERIENLKEVVRRLQSLLSSNNAGGQKSCTIVNNLYFGLTNSEEVRCLQQFLKLQGNDIYPEGIISGNFLKLTQDAVMRFQERYSGELLLPLGLNRPTGYVGQMTRNKINSFNF